MEITFSKDYIWPSGSIKVESALNLHCLWENAQWSNLMTGKAKTSIELIKKMPRGCYKKDRISMRSSCAKKMSVSLRNLKSVEGETA
jgi:hypothetical protein